jgi:hypothetical protein
MPMSEKDRHDAEEAAKRAASREDGRMQGIPPEQSGSWLGRIFIAGLVLVLVIAIVIRWLRQH